MPAAADDARAISAGHAGYVIVGAGSAGCVLAARLTEDPGVNVVLIDAGGRGRHPNVVIPAAFSRQFRTKRDSDYNTEPETHCDGRSPYVPRGKGLGGSSAMNAMLYSAVGRSITPGGASRAPRARGGTTCGRTSCATRTTRTARLSTTVAEHAVDLIRKGPRR